MIASARAVSGARRAGRPQGAGGYPGEAGQLTIDAGVEVVGDFEESGPVWRITTPAGEVAAVAHFGEYSDMGGAYSALDQWCAANDRRQAGVNREVYGDWDDDPAKRRTDVCKLLSPA